MERILYGKTADGQEVDGFAFRNKNGLELRCISYGASITHIHVPSQSGEKADVVLGYDTLAEYEQDRSFLGRTIGRYGNRISGAQFTLNGETYKLLQNEGENYLHGSLHSRVWNAEILGDNSVCFTYTSPDGDDGFPGELWVSVTYTLTDENELYIDYRARSDADTHVNLTNHSYFNLAGQGASVLDQEMMLNCDLFLEVDEKMLPTGRMLETAGGAFDFHQPKPIGQDIGANDPQLKLGNGYDHCFVINKDGIGLALAAHARDPKSGRSMRVYTTQPGVQLYAGDRQGGRPGKGGIPMVGSFCLETQHYPDTPNCPDADFPPTLLLAKEKYHQTAIWKFDW